jgi:lipopolysaccharide export system permease protein
MRLSSTLSVYIARHFLVGIALVLAVLVSLLFLVDFVELLRRASGSPTASFGIVLQMALLHQPAIAQKIIPFAVLFGGMVALSRLTRSNELVVARAAGVSVWQFLLPGLALAAVIGGVTVTVFNPLASATTWRYGQIENKHLSKRPSLLAVSSSGLWLREALPEGQSVVHAQRISQPDLGLGDVIIFVYQGVDHFVHRIDGSTAKLRDGFWELEDVLVSAPDRPSQHFDEYRLETGLTLDQIQESFAPPETMSFWELPGFIRTLESAGFSALRHRLYWHSLLAAPLLLCAMVLIAATFSLRLTRRGGIGLLILGGILAGFFLYVVTDVVLALGLSEKIPVALAAWSPAGIFTLLGLAMLLHLEDG